MECFLFFRRESNFDLVGPSVQNLVNGILVPLASLGCACLINLTGNVAAHFVGSRLSRNPQFLGNLDRPLGHPGGFVNRTIYRALGDLFRSLVDMPPLVGGHTV